MPVLTATHASPSSSSAASHAIRILADDLTGACDSAAPFLTAGHSVRVWLDGAALRPMGETVQAFNMRSRALPVGQTFGTVTKAATQLEADSQTLVFKKVDSAGRGHIAAEIIAAHQALETSAVLFAPSFPAAGRTVRDGILRITDAAGSRTQIRLMPLFQSEAVPAQISHPSEVRQAIAAGANVLVCDAQTQEELDALAALDIPNVLYAGSAGLAQSLAKLHPALHPGEPHALPRIARPLTICGTLHPVTQLQTRHTIAAHPTHPLLQIRAEAADVEEILAQFQQRDPEALILTGGDTALLVLTTLKAHSILLRGELAPGIPWGLIHGGLAHNRIVVTKSGGFGAPHTLTSIVQALTGATSA